MKQPSNTHSAQHATKPQSRPSWQLPQGVPRGLWDYAHSLPVAEDYDEYFAFNSLFDFDEEVARSCFQTKGLVADLGCGTGRALVTLCRDGHRGLAIDLSHHMLRIVQEKAHIENLPIACLQANMVQLGCLAENSVDHAVCLFSTLGMIRGRENRRRALEHARRILKPSGRFLLHVHNYWFNLRDPEGPGWVLRNLMQSAVNKEIEIGDRWFNYRGVPNMFLHVYRWGELRRDLTHTGFRIAERIPLNVQRRHRLKHAWWMPKLRTNGWLVVCE